ncbi:hypothetical protein AVEN_114053-1 [Araneus ventricosus]|uniref:Uncharacterized protein n=1 Tax=Araneus ventricosus TaxID=182803 RepID=A0A4Y2I1E2_ARAVE|nr:hypothetical protein AVEN_46364-1 [Araneus ventricosus]GBM71440.1 hypothetical protein AVEN_114053-1 [Araneus ventricosus]
MNKLFVYTVIAILLCNIHVEARRKIGLAATSWWGKRSPNQEGGFLSKRSPDFDKRSPSVAGYAGAIGR